MVKVVIFPVHELTYFDWDEKRGLNFSTHCIALLSRFGYMFYLPLSVCDFSLQFSDYPIEKYDTFKQHMPLFVMHEYFLKLFVTCLLYTFLKKKKTKLV